jgi:hypothetical protein
LSGNYEAKKISSNKPLLYLPQKPYHRFVGKKCKEKPVARFAWKTEHVTGLENRAG